jgi:hypothetical protein
MPAVMRARPLALSGLVGIGVLTACSTGPKTAPPDRRVPVPVGQYAGGDAAQRLDVVILASWERVRFAAMRSRLSRVRPEAYCSPDC